MGNTAEEAETKPQLFSNSLVVLKFLTYQPLVTYPILCSSQVFFAIGTPKSLSVQMQM